jgi:septal ring factor EnvC (AmiA/AmiB activator)
MKLRQHIVLVTAVCTQLWLISAAFTQEDADRQTREEWQAQVERARQRVEQIRREGAFVDQESESVQEAARATARRALEDEELRAGDVVSTENGFLRFDGLSADDKRIFSPVEPASNHGK